MWLLYDQTKDGGRSAPGRKWDFIFLNTDILSATFIFSLLLIRSLSNPCRNKKLFTREVGLEGNIFRNHECKTVFRDFSNKLHRMLLPFFAFACTTLPLWEFCPFDSETGKERKIFLTSGSKIGANSASESRAEQGARSSDSCVKLPLPGQGLLQFPKTKITQCVLVCCCAAQPLCLSPSSACWRTTTWTGGSRASCCPWAPPSTWTGRRSTRPWPPSSSPRSTTTSWTLGRSSP